MIYVIDDDSDTCRVIVRLLDDSGYQSTCFHNDEDELSALQHNLPTLLILDMEMPRISGADLLRAVRADPRLNDMAVVLLSATQDQKAIAEISNFGVQKHISKVRLDWTNLTFSIAEIIAPPGDIACGSKV